MTPNPYDQHGYRCKLEWGRRGVRDAAARGDIVVIVDALSFTSAVATAVERGAVVYPCGDTDDAPALAGRVGAELAVRREHVPSRGRFSLSPLTYAGIEPGVRVVLPSPNGATLSRLALDAPYVFAAAFLNAGAVADAVNSLLAGTDRDVTVVASGERWRTPHEDGPLRFALEDYLAAGAVIDALPRDRSPEAQAAAVAFRGMAANLESALLESASGRELSQLGYDAEVRFDARLNVFSTAPELRDERYAVFEPGEPSRPR